MKIASRPVRLILVLLMSILAAPACQLLEGSGGDLGLGTARTGDGDDGSSDGGTEEEEEEEEDDVPYGRIFVTTGTVDGQDAWVTPGEIAYEALDEFCQDEADTKDLDWWGRGTVSGSAGHYRAIVAFDGNRPRTACSTANCGGGVSEHVGKWPLSPDTVYFREDGITPIGTTNANGLFDFPLQNSVSGTVTHIWTGLNSNWTTYGFGMTYNCFTNLSNSTGYGQYAFANATNSTSFSIGDPTSSGMGEGSCSNAYPVMCAEVIPTILPTQPSYRKIFVTTGTYGMTFSGSKTQLDSACQSEANSNGLGFGGKAVYKALVQAPTQRLALYALGAFVAGPIDWIMEPNRQYRRADGTTVIGTTNAQAVLDFPLTNSMTGATDSYWTGFGRTDMFYNGDPAHPFAVFNVFSTGNETCGNFSTINGSFTARVGNGAETDASAFGNGLAACNSQQKLLCVEQTRSNLFYE